MSNISIRNHSLEKSISKTDRSPLFLEFKITFADNKKLIKLFVNLINKGIEKYVFINWKLFFNSINA